MVCLFDLWLYNFVWLCLLSRYWNGSLIGIFSEGKHSTFWFIMKTQRRVNSGCSVVDFLFIKRKQMSLNANVEWVLMLITRVNVSGIQYLIDFGNVLRQNWIETSFIAFQINEIESYYGTQLFVTQRSWSWLFESYCKWKIFEWEFSLKYIFISGLIPYNVMHLYS